MFRSAVCSSPLVTVLDRQLSKSSFFGVGLGVCYLPLRRGAVHFPLSPSASVSMKSNADSALMINFVFS